MTVTARSAPVPVLPALSERLNIFVPAPVADPHVKVVALFPMESAREVIGLVNDDQTVEAPAEQEADCHVELEKTRQSLLAGVEEASAKPYRPVTVTDVALPPISPASSILPRVELVAGDAPPPLALKQDSVPPEFSWQN